MLHHPASGTAFLISPDKKYIGSQSGQSSGVKSIGKRCCHWWWQISRTWRSGTLIRLNLSYQPRAQARTEDTHGLSHYNLDTQIGWRIPLPPCCTRWLSCWGWRFWRLQCTSWSLVSCEMMTGQWGPGQGSSQGAWTWASITVKRMNCISTSCLQTHSTLYPSSSFASGRKLRPRGKTWPAHGEPARRCLVAKLEKIFEPSNFPFGAMYPEWQGRPDTD